MGRGVGFESLEGLAGSIGTDSTRGGILDQEETEVGQNCEAAPYEEGEDPPPAYAEVVGTGAGIQFFQAQIEVRHEVRDTYYMGGIIPNVHW